jgi:4-alpha-glucanotransferase
MLERCAGVLIPLFSLRTERDLGRGEIGGLREMVDLAVAMGHRVIQLLPLDEPAPGEASPYSALSVFAIDPMYISAPALTDAAELRRAQESVGRRRTPPRARLRNVKFELLAHAFDSFEQRASPVERAEFGEFCAENHAWLDDYALFRGLKEKFKWKLWESWPDELRRREAGALGSARRGLADSIRKYCYWQYLADRQWRDVRGYAKSRGVLLGGDLAFSPSRDSAEVWANQAYFDLTRTVGAPPDDFNPDGQRWGLPMPNWERMRASGHQFWRARARRARSLYDIVRIDHVVGIYRTFSFAGEDDGGSFMPADEPQQIAQGEEVMRAILDEAAPADVIAEDLGTVPPWVRASLTRLGVPGYKVVRWEKIDWGGPDERFLSPSEYPELSLATTGTHDTETLTQWWRETTAKERRQFLAALGPRGRVSPDGRLTGRASLAILEALYAAPSRLAVTPIQDLFGWRARINRPGTVAPSNWRWRPPFTLERWSESATLRARVTSLRRIAERTGRFRT